MPEDLITPPAPAGDPTPTPTPSPMPTPGEPRPDNALAAQLRIAEKRAQEAEAQLKELQRKDMDEKQRLESEAADLRKQMAALEPLRDAHGRFTNAIEAACAAEIERMPEDKRDAIKDLTTHVPLEQRLAAIQKAALAIGASPTAAGTRTNPGSMSPPSPGAPDPAKPLNVADIAKMSFSDALRASPAMQRPAPGADEARLKAMEEKLAQITAAKP